MTSAGELSATAALMEAASKYLTPNAPASGMDTALTDAATKYLSSHADDAFKTIQPQRGVYEAPSAFSSRLLSSSYPAPLVYVDQEKGVVIAFYIVGQELAGHPNILHGGASSALIDEVSGRAAVERLPARKIAVTVKIDFSFKGPVFLSHKDGEQSLDWAIVAVGAEVESVRGRVANVKGWIANLETGEKLVESSSVFVEPREASQ